LITFFKSSCHSPNIRSIMRTLCFIITFTCSIYCTLGASVSKPDPQELIEEELVVQDVSHDNHGYGHRDQFHGPEADRFSGDTTTENSREERQRGFLRSFFGFPSPSDNSWRIWEEEEEEMEELDVVDDLDLSLWPGVTAPTGETRSRPGMEQSTGNEQRTRKKESQCSSYPASHTMNIYRGPSVVCTQRSLSSGLDKAAQDRIVDVHNQLRNKVAMGQEFNGAQPSASDMRKLVWDDELAAVAQRWTDQCTFGHDGNRDLCDGTYVGQNAATSSRSTRMEPSSGLIMGEVETAVRNWYSEVKQPGFNSNHISPFAGSSGAGHYTQLVWAATDRVGCGLRYYQDGVWFTTLTICNYAKGGNMVGDDMYKVGAPCTRCPPSTTCDATFPGLCTAKTS